MIKTKEIYNFKLMDKDDIIILEADVERSGDGVTWSLYFSEKSYDKDAFDLKDLIDTLIMVYEKYNELRALKEGL